MFGAIILQRITWLIGQTASRSHWINIFGQLCNKSPLFRGNTIGDVINWETAPLILDGMNTIKKDRDSLCSQDDSFYAVLPFRESMMSMKRLCEKLGGRMPILTTSLEVNEELLRITKQSFRGAYSKRHRCAVPLLLNLLSKILHCKISWLPTTKVKRQRICTAMN